LALTGARPAAAAEVAPDTLPERTAVELLGSVATLQARLMALLRRAIAGFENGAFGGS
jgi:hypothetical protein